MNHATTRTMAGLTLGLLWAAGCASALDQDRPVHRPAEPTSRPAVATGQRGVEQPLPGLDAPPKPFVDLERFKSTPTSVPPSGLLMAHASPDAPVPLSAYGEQPVHQLEEFQLGPTLTGAAVRRQFGPPAGLAGIVDSWAVYRLPRGRELWLHFLDGDGPLLAADRVRGRENGYSRERLYPER